MPERYWSGERLETFVKGEAMLEHLHRYAIAASLAPGKSVLDIACGEGFGSNLLSQSATNVTAVDINTQVIENARKKYRAGNIEFLVGDIFNIPAEEKRFDLVVCFETIEHVDHHNEVINELKRVLKPGGVLMVSTPDKRNYTDNGSHNNKFHKKELYESEFRDLIRSNFSHSQILRQNSTPSSIMISETNKELKTYYGGDYMETRNADAIAAIYWIALASDAEIPSISSSIYQHDKSLSGLLHEEASLVKKTITYRIGNIFLTPLKLLLSIFKK